MASLKAKQDDLRKLMKERRENLKDQKSRVDSPFAKYNSLGQLFCVICNIQIKSNGLWVPHVAGKIHKENALKRKKVTTDAVLKNNTHTEIKRNEIDLPPAKKFKGVIKEPSLVTSEPTKSSEKSSLLDAYSSSSSDDESDSLSVQPSVSNTVSSSALPKDFFDGSPSTSNNTETAQKGEKIPAVAPTNAAEALPEGFFDDPVLDAKARNIEYKDPIEEEWEKYQKAIVEETNVSKTIIAEDLEESVLERDISQIDEQILQWKKIKVLESLADEVKAKAPSKDDKGNLSGISDDELDEDELLDWRTKSVAKR